METIMIDRDKQPRDLEFIERANALSNAVYAASALIYQGEEYRRNFLGNGHHAAQRLCEVARQILADGWKTSDPK